MATSKKWKEEYFNVCRDDNNMVFAWELRSGDMILMSNGNLFFIDDIDEEYISDEVAKLYDDVTEAIPEHTIYTICGGKSDHDIDKITAIPYNAKFHIWRMYDKSKLK